MIPLGGSAAEDDVHGLDGGAFLGDAHDVLSRNACDTAGIFGRVGRQALLQERPSAPGMSSGAAFHGKLHVYIQLIGVRAAQVLGISSHRHALLDGYVA